MSPQPQARPAGNGSAPARTPAPPRPALAAAIRAFGLGAAPKARMPEDFSLGPLQSRRPSAGPEAGALAAASAFMDSYAKGKLDAAALLPEAREALVLLLAPPQPAKDAEPYRLGAARLEGQAASFLVRLPRAKDGPRIEGLLSLRSAEGRWYVESLALEPPAEAALSFDPASRPAREFNGN